MLKQVAKLLDKKYEILYDSTELAITGPSFTVVDKKLKENGIHVKMNISGDPELELRSYFNPIFPIHASQFSIKPSMDSENFPILDKKQLLLVERKIKAIDRATLTQIKNLNNNALVLTKDKIFSLVSHGNGLDLRIFSKYGLKVDYKKYILNPSKDMLTNYRLIQVVAASDKDKKVKALLPDVINMYFEEVSKQSREKGLKSIRRFDHNIANLFNRDNEDKYIEMVKSKFKFSKGYKFAPETDGWIADEYMTILDNSRIENELMNFFYENTKNENFLSDEVKDIFLF